MSITREEVQALREEVQAAWSVGSSQARVICSELVYSSLRAWQNWESGDRTMPQSSKELLEIKISRQKRAVKRAEKLGESHGL